VTDDLTAACEALLFVAAEPLALSELAAAAEAGEDAIERALADLERRLLERGAGVVLDRSGGRFGLRAAPGGPAEAASRLQARAPERGLSPAALEALAVVAYLQPVGRPEIARIRGVSSDAVVAGLLERQLIEESGRGDGLGAPVLYRTTATFDRIFGLDEGIGGLPSLGGEDEIDSDELRQRLHAVATERG
jgi:segregation and condensation protein B